MPSFEMVTLRKWPRPEAPVCPDCKRKAVGVNSYDEPHTDRYGNVTSHTTYEEWECPGCGCVWTFPLETWRWKD